MVEEKIKECNSHIEEGVDTRKRDLISEQEIIQEQQFTQIRWVRGRWLEKYLS